MKTHLAKYDHNNIDGYDYVACSGTKLKTHQTTKISKVTCKNCQRTELYKERKAKLEQTFLYKIKKLLRLV
jgi:predicted nucleic-acid-binding Zn-ribbon protein